jgi:DNA-directed RNA polymerase sigma subunit (sigma70/sigma32)
MVLLGHRYPGNVAERDEEYARRAKAAPRMTDAQAVELLIVAQSGDLAAHRALMDSHRRIVARVAKRYAQTDLSSEERLHLGEQGLGLAIEKFDIAKGFSFATYATWRIRQAITMGLGGGESGGAVREPRSPRPSSDAGSAAL